MSWPFALQKVTGVGPQSFSMPEQEVGVLSKEGYHFRASPALRLAEMPGRRPSRTLLLDSNNELGPAPLIQDITTLANHPDKFSVPTI